jgi:hypothetical protein
MGTSHWNTVWVAGLLLVAAAGGCQKEGAKTGSAALAPSADLGPTIGTLAEVIKPEPVALEGYGLVRGLAGTGSGYCPPEVREYLKQYIMTQLPASRVNIDELISSKNSTVVRLEATAPALPSVGDRFDVRVALLPGSEATSLQGGWLYEAELVVKGAIGAGTKSLATAKGPVFINPIGTVEIDPRSGYILGGGRILYDYTAVLRLRKPNYASASFIRNRLSERYGPNIAQALSAAAIEVRIPSEYSLRKQRFLSIIPATFLEVTNELNAARINTYVQALTESDNKESSEIGLEAVGRESAGKLVTLVNSPNAEVRLRAGRCLLGLGDSRGLAPLRELALEPKSTYRLEALEAVLTCARRADAGALAQRLLGDEDVAVVLAAYEGLRQIDDRAVAREVIGRGFLLEQVAQSRRKAIYVSRSGDPCVVLFGAPLLCQDNLFVESPDQEVVLDSRTGQGYVSVIRKRPNRPGVIGPIRSSPDVANIIRTLGGEPAAGSAGPAKNLGIPYSQVISLLEQMSAKQAVAAEFWAGPLPKMGPVVKK